jgi:hypothetical protein
VLKSVRIKRSEYDGYTDEKKEMHISVGKHQRKDHWENGTNGRIILKYMVNVHHCLNLTHNMGYYAGIVY